MRSKEDFILKNKQLTPTTPPTFTQKIGKTTYQVAIYFSETSLETFDDKMKRLMLNDLANLEKNQRLIKKLLTSGNRKNC